MVTALPPLIGPELGRTEVTAGCARGCPANVMFCCTSSPLVSPYATTHEYPAFIWVWVGGHGNFVASVEALPPVESVPVVGGPIVPVVTLNVVFAGKAPPEVVVTSLLVGT